jgi:hypothetical protein
LSSSAFYLDKLLSGTGSQNQNLVLTQKQPGLQSFEHFDGELGQAGAKWPEGGEVVTRGKIN